MDFTTGNYGGSSATDIWYAPFTARYDYKRISFRTTIPYLNLTGPGNVLGPGIGGVTIGDGGIVPGVGGGSIGGGSGGVFVCNEEDGDCSTTEDDPDDDNSGSGGGGSDPDDDDNSGSGGGGSDPDDDDNSGSGGGGSDPDDDDNSGSGGGGSDPDDDDNSGSGGGGSDPDDDNSGSGGGGSDPDDDDDSGSGGGGSDPDDDNSGSGGGGSGSDDNSGSGGGGSGSDDNSGSSSRSSEADESPFVESALNQVGIGFPSNASRSNHSGLGDVVTALTYNVFNHEPTGIIFDITGRIKAPTASAANNLGTGQVDYAIQGDLIKSMSRFMLSASFGYRILGNPSGVNFHNVFYGAAGIAFRYSPDTTIGTSFNIGQSPVRLQDSRDFTLYVSHRLNDNFRLNIYGLRGASERSPDWGGGINLRYVF